MHWKISNLRERQSKPSGLSQTKESQDDAPKKDELSLASPSTGTQEQEDPLASLGAAQSSAPVELDGTNKVEEPPQLRRSVTRKRAMQDWVQKTGAHLRTQSASLRARGQKISEGMRGNKKSKVVCSCATLFM